MIGVLGGIECCGEDGRGEEREPLGTMTLGDAGRARGDTQKHGLLGCYPLLFSSLVFAWGAFQVARLYQGGVERFTRFLSDSSEAPLKSSTASPHTEMTLPSASLLGLLFPVQLQWRLCFLLAFLLIYSVFCIWHWRITPFAPVTVLALVSFLGSDPFPFLWRARIPLNSLSAIPAFLQLIFEDPAFFPSLPISLITNMCKVAFENG